MRIKFAPIIAVCFALLSPQSTTHAQVSKSTLNANTSTSFPDNSTGAITPATTRSYLSGLINSFQQYAGIRNVTGVTDTIGAADYGQLVIYNNAGAIAVSLPQATGSFATFNFYVTNLGAGTVTITPSSSTINGSSSFAVPTGLSAWIISDGTNWQVWKGFGSGSINTGAAGQLAYYALSGVAVSGTPNASISAGALSLGTPGSVVGSIGFGNATSGTETIQPATGALGSGVATLPAGTYNIVGDSLTQTLTTKTLNCANNTCTVRIANDVSGLGTNVAAALGNTLNASGGLVGFNALGTGVFTALGNSLNGAGGMVGVSGALGTPTSGTLTNATGLPVASGISGLGTGVAAALAINANGAGAFPTYAASTWTPTVTTSGTVGTPAYTAQVGTYEIIGRQITVRLTLILSGWTGSPTGNVSIAGLPVTSANVSNDNGVCHFASYVVSGLTASNVLTGTIGPNTSTITMLQVSNTTSSSVTAAQAGTTPLFVGECSYHT